MNPEHRLMGTSISRDDAAEADKILIKLRTAELIKMNVTLNSTPSMAKLPNASH